MDALPQEAALVSPVGKVIGANALWTAALKVREDSVAPGEDLLERMQRLAETDPFSKRVAEALEAALRGARSTVALASPTEPSRGSLDMTRLAGVDAVLVLRTPSAAGAAGVDAREAQQRAAALQALLDMAPIGLSVALDSSGERIRGNRAVEQMFGIPGGGEISKTAEAPPRFRIYQNGRELTAGELPMQRAVRGETVGGDILDIARGDGGNLTVFAKAMPLYDGLGDPRGAVGAFMDITKIKNAEQALKESELRCRCLVEAYAQAVWETDGAGVVVADSPTWRDYTGQTLEEWLGFGWLDAVHPDDRAYAEMRWREAVATRANVDAEFRIRHASEWRWTNVRATPLINPDGAISKWIGMNIDIDARKRAEIALRENEDRQAFLLDLIDALRRLVDPADIQATACRMLAERLDVNRVSYADIEGNEFIVRQSHGRGVAPFMVRMPFEDLGAALIEKYRNAEVVAIRDVAEEQEFTQQERERFQAAEITALASVVVAKRNRWVGTLCVHNATPRDWTPAELDLIREVAERIWSAAERARAQAALRESEFRLQLALSSGKIGIYEWRIETDELIWDERLRAQWGLRADAPASYAALIQGIHPADRARVQAAIERAMDPMSGRLFAEEYRVVSRIDGAERWIAASGAVFFEGGKPVRMVGTVQNVTDRKRIEAERQKFVALAEQSLEFIGICNVAFEPLYLNPAGAAALGLDRDDAMPPQIDEFFFPEDRDFIFNAFFPKVRRAGHAKTEVRFRHFRSGEALWMLYNVFELRDEADAPIGYATVSQDITDRKRAEDALKAADRRKDEFLATLAHELRNPLAPLRNAIHILRHDAATAMTNKRDLQLFGMIDRQVEHLVRLVDDLLEVSRITRGKIELKRQSVDLAAMLRNAVETAQPTIDKARHRLHVSLPAAAVTLDADPIRLTQVFTNLLNNAAKYTEHGGDIWLMAERRGAEAIVSVRDSGVGIPAEMLPRVFDLFTQVDRSLGRAQGGLGIGLSLVKSLLEMHGGSVEAQSEGLGRGSAFIVRLPLVDEKPTEKAMPATSTQMQASRRVLVIDDDHDVADSLVMFLETFGATVRVAYGGEDGLETLTEFKPDLVFLDLGMPGMDGYETARRIRALPEGRAAKLVALTGWGQEQVYQRAREAGFDSQLTKPAGFEALQELLAS